MYGYYYSIAVDVCNLSGTLLSQLPLGSAYWSAVINLPSTTGVSFSPFFAMILLINYIYI